MHLLEGLLVGAGFAWMVLYVICALTRPEPGRFSPREDGFMFDLVARELEPERPAVAEPSSPGARPM